MDRQSNDDGRTPATFPPHFRHISASIPKTETIGLDQRQNAKNGNNATFPPHFRLNAKNGNNATFSPQFSICEQFHIFASMPKTETMPHFRLNSQSANNSRRLPSKRLQSIASKTETNNFQINLFLPYFRHNSPPYIYHATTALRR